MQHVEFFHKDHFENRYHRIKPKKSLSNFIDFFWQTDFDDLYSIYPNGFSDALFPNIGYTYLINLGTSFVMQLGNEKFTLKSDGFLPRHKSMICHHSTGNKIFGIKFKVSPIVFQKNLNFSEYKEYIFPLAYLIDKEIISHIKCANTFEMRVDIVSEYYQQIIEHHGDSIKKIKIVTEILSHCSATKSYNKPIEEIASSYAISSRTLGRYFEAATSISSKKALQILRIRNAVESLVNDPESFQFSDYGYYDYSHFFKHLRQFLCNHTITLLKPHLLLLNGRVFT